MNARLSLTILLFAAAPLALRSADEEPRPKSMKEILKARIAEDAKKQAPAATPAKTETPETPAQPAPSPAAEAPKSTPAKKSDAKAKEPATVLPKVEVKKGRITELDQKLAKQEEDIARERKNLKTSEVDAALNDAKIARPLSILGGESTQFRKHVASERIELMEAEKDLMEAIARAKTKEQKAELEKQLNELRAVRRELEKSLR